MKEEIFRFSIIAALCCFYACKKDVPVNQEVISSNSNNFQGDGAIVISDNITSDTTLTNHRQGTDYRIAICLKVTNGARLKIEPGVSVEMTPGSSVEISDGASILWEGTSTDRITISGLEKVRGSWRGIYLFSKGVNQVMKYCTIQHAGSDIYTIQKRSAINVFGAAMMMDNCVVRDNYSNALYMDSAAVNAGIHNCTFTANFAEPVMLDHVNCDILTDDNIYTGNTFDRVYIRTLRNVQTFRTLDIPKLSIPYTIDSTFDIGTHVNIQPGVKIIMQKLSLLYANDSLHKGASISAIGNANNRIVFEGQLPKKGYWQGIGLDNGASCDFQFCDIKYCGFANNYNSQYPEAMINVSGPANTSCNVSNCFFSFSSTNGIALDSPFVSFNADIYNINTYDSINNLNVIIY